MNVRICCSSLSVSIVTVRILRVAHVEKRRLKMEEEKRVIDEERQKLSALQQVFLLELLISL